jgi:hypothetical protein
LSGDPLYGACQFLLETSTSSHRCFLYLHRITAVYMEMGGKVLTTPFASAAKVACVEATAGFMSHGSNRGMRVGGISCE